MTLKMIILFIFSGWFFFWVLLYVYVTEAAYPPNVQTDKQAWCESVGGAYKYKANKDFTIDCLTETHAIFNSKDDLVNYMMYYKDQFDQQPAIFLKD